MEINSFFENKIYRSILNSKDDKSSSLIKGKILKIEGEKVFLEIQGKGTIEAKSSLNLEKILGEEMEFLINFVDENNIEIKPVLYEESSKDKVINEEDSSNKNIVEKLLDLKIKPSSESISLFKDIVDNDEFITKKDVLKVFKAYEKTLKILDLENPKIEIINNNLNSRSNKTVEDLEDLNFHDNIFEVEFTQTEDIDGKVININSKLDKLVSNFQEFKEELIVDIENLLISDEGDGSLYKTNNANTFESDIDNRLNHIMETFTKEDLKEAIIFLSKNKVKNSINNIIQFKKITKDPFIFLNELKDSKEVILAKEDKVIELIEKIDKLGKNLTKEEIQNLNELKTFLTKEEDLKNKLIDIRYKTEFLSDLNKEIYFNIIPFNDLSKDLGGYINILKEKSKIRGKETPISVLINLETINLGDVKVACLVEGERLDLKIKVNKKNLDLFKASKEKLRLAVSKYKYEIRNLEFTTEDISIVDKDSKKLNKINFLDIRI